MPPEPKKLLFIGANPALTDNIRIGKEWKNIQEIAESSEEDACLTLDAKECLLAQKPELLELFETHQPDILHISAHGTTDGEMLLHDENDEATPLNSLSLMRMLDVSKVRPTYIILNACASSDFARELCEYADCIIGTTEAISSDIAIKFSNAFYRKLITRGFTKAFESALVQIEEGYGCPRGLYVVHQQSTLATEAFIVQPVGNIGTEKRERADRIYDELIRPCCDRVGLTPIRAHELSGHSVTEPIVNSLRSARLVIVDLGHPPWNANVMTELGYRLATGRPLVIMADTAEDLPTLLGDPRRFVTNEEPERLDEFVKDALKRVDAFESNFPTVEIAVESNIAESKYIYANEAAARLYAIDFPWEIMGKLVIDLDAQVSKWMPEEHAEQFNEEQETLFQKCLRPGNDHDLRATIPLWFTEHPDANYNGKVFWPLLTQKSDATQTKATVLRVAFIDITSWVRADCDSIASDKKKLPFDFTAYERFDYDVVIVLLAKELEDATDIDLKNTLLGTLTSNSVRNVNFFNLSPSDGNNTPLLERAHQARAVILVIPDKKLSNEIQNEMVNLIEKFPNKPILVIATQPWSDAKTRLQDDLCKALDDRNCPSIHVDLNGSAKSPENHKKIEQAIQFVRMLLKQELEPRVKN